MKTLHPPLKPGEKFLGNTENDALWDNLKHIKGIRFARPAYDIDGGMLPDHWAMIADQPAADEYDRVMDAVLSAIRRGTK